MISRSDIRAISGTAAKAATPAALSAANLSLGRSLGLSLLGLLLLSRP